MREATASDGTPTLEGSVGSGIRAKFLVVETESSRELLPLSDVVELSGPLPIVPTPSDPTAFDHAILHRDLFLPVLDLDALLGRAKTNADKPGAYAIIELDGRRCALAVKCVIGLSVERDFERALDLRRLLSRVPLTVKPAETTSERSSREISPASRYLLVELAGQTCGFELAGVVHLYSERQVVRAPKTDDSLAVGVTAIGGRVLPVLDLAGRLGLSAKIAMPNFVELNSPEGGTFVIAVERISGIATIAQEVLSQPPEGRAVDAVAQLGPKTVWIVTPELIAKRDRRGRDGF